MSSAHEQTGRPAHVQRCTYVEADGQRLWQCTQPDPHPSGQGHAFAPDKQFGRLLHEQRPDWLAAQLRDQAVLNRHLQRRLDELTAIAVDLADSFAGGSPVRRVTGEWIRATAPDVAARLDEAWLGTEHWQS